MWELGEVSVGTAADETSAIDTSSASTDVSTSEADSTETSAEGSDDTIMVTDFSDMPPKCVELLGAFLRKLEPTVSAIDWDKATLAEFETISDSIRNRLVIIRDRTRRGWLRQVQPRRNRREAVRTDGGVGRSRSAGHSQLHQLPGLAGV